ncbi:MAG: hypothetical protein HY015_06125 [Bacteroidetes bacterium]|nr:hypothetical protein [Bacteroidota bacterium]MBI3482539.1 hypothetical protein [Bacteroidota bacterium]
MRSVSVFAILLLTCFAGRAQETKKDTTGLSSDSVRLKNGKVVNIRSYASRFDPRKAMFYSAILPGAGQAYNKKYWKVPLVYGGLLGLIAVVKFYNDGEAIYKEELFYLINHPTLKFYPGTLRTPESLRRTVDQARRQRDYFIILTGFFYILQMVDAHVDAHLKEFDLNPQLHVRIEPSYTPASGVGMGLTLRF